ADDDLAKVRALLAEEPGTIPVDVYSVTGIDGSAFHGVAYYPPPLARHLLERAVVHHSGCRVPAPEDHLYSLAYHALFHKGRLADSDHDYAAVLDGLARRVGVEVPLTLDGLDEHLAAVGWRPPVDTIRRLAPGNHWLRHHLSDDDHADDDQPEPAVFLVREQAIDVLGLDEIVRVLRHFGFDPLLVRSLDANARRRCTGG